MANCTERSGRKASGLRAKYITSPNKQPRCICMYLAKDSGVTKRDKYAHYTRSPLSI